MPQRPPHGPLRRRDPRLSGLPATAVLAAAGSGQRLGAGGSKAFVELCERPLIQWSLAALDAAETIGAIVIAAPPGGEAQAKAVAAAVCGKPVTVIAGGATRAASVALALDLVDDELIAIHDAARPLLSPDLVDRIVRRLTDSTDADAVIAATPIVDTVKRSRAGRSSGKDGGDGATSVAETLDRDALWAAQTPQAFRVDALVRAQGAARDAGELELATDEAWLIERVGGTVLIEPAPPSNLKVTTAADLATASALLRSGRS